MWAFDVRGMDDLRAKFKRGMGLEGVDLKEAEEEFEEWLAETFARKEGKEKEKEREREREEGRTTERFWRRGGDGEGSGG